MSDRPLRLTRASVVFAVGVALVGLSCRARIAPTGGPVVAATARDGLSRITAERLLAHMAILADDAMTGRETGTRGFDLAAEYVVDHFRDLGLSPAGASYLQPITIRRARPIESETALSVTIDGRRERLAYGRDFVTYGVLDPSGADVSGPIVFVGDGVTVPGAIDAYRGLEVGGAVGIALPGASMSLTTSERSYYGSSRLKAANGAARGLTSLLLLDDPNIPWELRVRAARQLGINQAQPSEGSAATVPVVYLSAPAAEKILGDRDGSALAGGSVLGDAELRIRQATRHVRSANVVGIWPAADHVSAPEHVVVVAHLDHVGIGAPVNGDAIYNGAVDNASGVAALITIAEAFASLPTRRARSVAFLATTGEEQGLVGSEYFVRQPPLPVDSIVAALNVDGTSIVPFDALEIRGGSNSSLGAIAEAAATELGLGVRHQPLGVGGSDHAPFLLAGVPALWIGAALPTGWMQTYYHTPRDDLEQPLDLAAAARYARFVFLTAYLVADTLERPAWNAGEFFGTLRLP